MIITFIVQGNISFCVYVLIKALWVERGFGVFILFYFFLLPFYVSSFRMAFLNGGDQLLIVH